jgi:hypothetical protein
VVTTTREPSSSTSIAERASTRLRQHVIEVLELLQVPTPRHLLQDVLAARGTAVDLRQLSRFGRAEERRLRTSAAPTTPALVPAISSLDLTAIPGTLTCWSWSLEQRIVGMYTPRARHLRVLLRLLDDAPLVASEGGQRLIVRLAETVPGATLRGRMREPMEVRAAAEAELSHIEPLDLAERGEAAARLSALAPAFQLWGQPALLSTAPDTDGARP